MNFDTLFLPQEYVRNVEEAIEHATGDESALHALIELEGHIQKLLEEILNIRDSEDIQNAPSKAQEIFGMFPFQEPEEILRAGISDRTRRKVEALFLTGIPEATHISIDDYLDELQQRLSAIFSQNNVHQIIKDLGIVYEKLSGIILPPEMQGILKKGENGGEWREKKEFPRFQLFLELLRDIGVFADDIIVRDGAVSSEMMRKTSYFCIEIPRLNRTVFISQEYGEATFVYEGYFPEKEYVNSGKTMLPNTHPKRVFQKICFTKGEEDGWKARVTQALLGSLEHSESPSLNSSATSHQSVREKIPVRFLEEIRIFFSEQGIDTPEAWMAKKQSDKKVLQGRFQEHFHKGLSAIGKEWGYTPPEWSGREYFHPISFPEDWATLGRAIFGDHEVFNNIFEKRKNYLESQRGILLKKHPIGSVDIR